LKVLLDSCVWGGTKQMLQEAGHDVVWSGDWDVDPGDAEILEIAHREEPFLVTLDKDFGELAIVHAIRHSGIVRLVNFGARQQAAAARYILERHGSELAQGAIATAEPGRLRVRPATQGS
jgi:predicted nuclease of predicted toxin-antitoxin system